MGDTGGLPPEAHPVCTLFLGCLLLEEGDKGVKDQDGLTSTKETHRGKGQTQGGEGRERDREKISMTAEHI